MPKSKWHIPPKARADAACELMDLADRMFRGGQSLMSKAARLIEGDPAKDHIIMGAIVRYQDSAMPATDEVARIEAVLRGVPAQKCLSEAEKRRRRKDKQARERDERSKERDQEEWAEFWAWKRKQFWAERERAERKTEVTEDGVIQGPWGEAS